MGSVEHGRELMYSNMGIELRGSQALMAQELLDGTQVAAVIEQVGGAGMAIEVRADAAGLCEESVEGLGDKALLAL
jgi:hypothetical protein